MSASRSTRIYAGALVFLGTVPLSAATVKYTLVPGGVNPADVTGPSEVGAAGGQVPYEVWAEVLDDDNGGLAAFLVSIATTTGVQQPTIAPEDFAPIVREKFTLETFVPMPWGGWQIDDDLIQVAGFQNTFGQQVPSGDPLDPSMLESGLGIGAPVFLFRGMIHLGDSEPDPADPATWLHMNLGVPGPDTGALVWRPHDDPSQLVLDSPDFIGFPTVLRSDIEVEVGRPEVSVAIEGGIVVIPEPTTSLLLLVGTAAVVRLRRRA